KNCERNSATGSHAARIASVAQPLRRGYMRTLFVCALTATLVGCSCFVSPQTGIEACTGTSGWFACVDKAAVIQTAEPELASFETTPAKPRTKSKVAARTEKPSSARDH